MAGRLPYIDRARGLIVALMALDHARFFVSRDHTAEFWGVPLPVYHGDPVPFVTRLVSHLCAPGFCFLMGVSMALLAARRSAAGASRRELAAYFARRGGLIIALQALTNLAWLLGSLSAQVPTETHGSGPAPGYDPDVPLLMGFGVLYMLGGVMLLWGLLIRARTPTVALVALLSLTVPLLALPDAASEPAGLLRNLLYVPGHTGSIRVSYPLLPWAGIAGLGILFGRVLQSAPERASPLLFGSGALSLLAFLAIRLSGGPGNLHAPAEPGWIGFLNVTKYPPSWAFMSLTLGAFWLVMAALSRRTDGPAPDRPLMVFGQTAMGFYIAHLFLYAALSVAFPQGAPFGVMYAAWLLSLAPLYAACRRWRSFKRSKPPSSLWRML